MTAFVGGNRERFEAQVLPHLDAAYRFAMGLTRSRSDAEDLVQDAMLRAYRAVETLRGQNARPWLLTIIRNCYFSARASDKRRTSVPLPDPEQGEVAEALVEPSPDPESASLLEAQRQAVGRSMSRLS